MHTPEVTPITGRFRASRIVTLILPSIAVILLSQLAVAHHGWAWAEDQQSTLAGKIKSISMSAPHPTLEVTAADGAVWQVDLGNPSQTERSGFTAESSKAGDAITVLGNRNREQSKNHMKAVRITIAGKSYDLYPERIAPKQ
jgi:hypothetical protein